MHASQMQLVRQSLHGEPALEVALAATLLTAVAAGRRPPILRVYRPPATVAFGRRDSFLHGFTAAADAARQHGFTPLVRAQGGRAAAYDERCLVIDQIMPSPDSMSAVQERFAQDAVRHAGALKALGVDARVGRVPGEYCPGPFTVNAGGTRKLLGSAQRIVRGGWLLSTVVVVDGSDRLRSVLEDVYGALELEWNPQTLGAIGDEVPAVNVDTIAEALIETSYAPRYALRPKALSPDELNAAAEAIDRFRVDEPAASGLGGRLRERPV